MKDTLLLAYLYVNRTICDRHIWEILLEVIKRDIMLVRYFRKWIETVIANISFVLLNIS